MSAVGLPAAGRREEALEVAPLSGGAAAWDRFVASAAGSTACHLSGWREIMGEVMGHRSHYLVARDAAGEWHGVLPLVEMRSRLFGHHLVSMPFLSDGGPLGTEEGCARLAERAVELARELGADLLEIRTRRPIRAELPAARSKVAVHLPLPDSPGILWGETFGGKLRSQIRRPIKEGMEVRFGRHQLEAFYRVFSRNMRDLGTPVLPRRLFERIALVFPERVLFGAVHHHGVPVAAGCGFLWDGELEMTWASSLREHARLAPNMLLYWSFMQAAIERGARRFNFGRCSPGSGTHRFKLQWGGEEVPLPWVEWRPSGSPPHGPEGRVQRLAVAAWKRLPMAVASRVGPVVSRRIPWF